MNWLNTDSMSIIKFNNIIIIINCLMAIGYVIVSIGSKYLYRYQPNLNSILLINIINIKYWIN